MNEQVLLTDFAEIGAVRRGELEGTVYKDGEVYVDAAVLRQWRDNKASAGNLQSRMSLEAKEGKR